jgi:pimeloyl-ACP methyl ester carboxylesterase
MNKKTLKYKSTTIEYHINGNGYPVILLHGFGEDNNIWKGFVKKLSRNYTCILPQIPGSGNTSPLPGSVSIADYADLIHAIIKAEKYKKVFLCGHSMGGYISMEFAKKYEKYLCGLTLFHSSSYADDEMKKDRRRKAIKLINSKGPMALLRTAIPGLFHNKEKHHAEIEQLLASAEQFTAFTLVQYYEAMINREETSDVLQKIKVPVQFILGQFDKATPFKHGLAQSHLPTFSQLTILRDSGHMGMFEEPEKSYTALKNFIGECTVK